MKHLVTVLFVTIPLFSATLYSQTPNYRWAMNAGGAGSEEGYGIAVDAAGNSYVTGNFNDAALTFGTTTLVNAGSGLYDVFVAKYDLSGNVVWARRGGGSSSDYSAGIAVDAAGSSVVTGSFYSATVTFGATTLTNVGGAGTLDVFTVKYDASGNVLWAKSGGAAVPASDAAYAAAVDIFGNSYITGYFSGATITFGATVLTRVGTQDMFIVKYDGTGTVVWAKNAGGASGFDDGHSIAVDATGNSYVTGTLTGLSTTFGVTVLPSAGVQDMYVVKYDANGNVLWAKSAGGVSSEYGYGIAIDASGNSFVTGWYSSATLTFGATTLTNQGLADTYVVKYDAGGTVVWAKNVGGTDTEVGNGIAADASGNSYVTGFFRSSTLSIGSTLLTIVSATINDVFVAKYDPAGVPVWAKSAGGTGHDFGVAIALDAVGNSYVTGISSSPSITFGLATFTNPTAPNHDMFVTKISIPPAIASIVDVPDDQGGEVRIKWNKSSEDVVGVLAQVTSYSIWRKSPGGASAVTKTNRYPYEITLDSVLLGYDYVASVPSVQLPQYQTVVPTLEDSSSSGIHRFKFLVVAHNAGVSDYVVSLADSGYSVDNLAPIPPAGLMATLQAGPQVKLTWDLPIDPDVRSYAVYRSTINGFTPSPGNQIGSSSSTTFTDAAPLSGDQSYYRIVAVDIHDNVSAPSSTAGVPVTLTQTFSLRDKWNLISVPLTVGDYTKTLLYPTAISKAFAYQGSYVAYGTLKNATGYWMKFNGVQAVPMAGLLRNSDTVDVSTGWNLIGSISSPLGASSVISIPGGMITSKFFGYAGSYQNADTIQPGLGYWVKVNASGKLLLSSGSIAVPSSKIRITPTEELPPAPPDEIASTREPVPGSYALEQNYPNPFNPATTIAYALPADAHVKLSVYNMLGQEVARLIDEFEGAGFKSVSFDAGTLPSGMYVYRISAGTFTDEKKLLLVK